MFVEGAESLRDRLTADRASVPRQGRLRARTAEQKAAVCTTWILERGEAIRLQVREADRHPSAIEARAPRPGDPRSTLVVT